MKRTSVSVLRLSDPLQGGIRSLTLTLMVAVMEHESQVVSVACLIIEKGKVQAGYIT